MKTIITIAIFIFSSFCAFGQVSTQEYALLSAHVYLDSNNNVALPPTWMIYEPYEDPVEGVFAIAYRKIATNELVIAFRGTDELQDQWESNYYLANDTIPPYYHHMRQAFIDETITKYNNEFNTSQLTYLTFTGHSLGGALAVISSLYYDSDAIVFDNPAIGSFLAKDPPLEFFYLQSNHKITSFCSAPNLVNTLNNHLGTVYRIYPPYDFNYEDIDELADDGPYDTPNFILKYYTYTIQQHSIVNIYNLFEEGADFPPVYSKQTNDWDQNHQLLYTDFTGSHFLTFNRNPYFWTQLLETYNKDIEIFVPKHLGGEIQGDNVIEGYTIYGDDTDNEIWGGTNFSDKVYGYEGDDEISTFSGVDVLFPGKGADILNGGLGKDFYMLDFEGFGWDQITDEDGGLINLEGNQLMGTAFLQENERYLLPHLNENFEIQIRENNDGTIDIFIYREGLDIDITSSLFEFDVIEIIDFENGDFDIFLEDSPLNVFIEGESNHLICPNTSYETPMLKVIIEPNFECNNCTYDIQWSTGATTESIAVVENGTYSVTVTYDGLDPVSDAKSVLFELLEDCNTVDCQPGDICWGLDGIGAYDPNEIVGPNGVGIEKWVNVNKKLNYTVYFENDPDFATAPAQTVRIEHVFDEEVNPYSLRLGNFGFGNYNFVIPENTSYYNDQLDLRDSLGIYINVVAGINVNENKAFWIFESVDPATGLNSTLGATTGFLPINDTLTRAGEGFVSFSVNPYVAAQTGDTISADATIFFDENPPIETNTTYNLIDASKPESSILSAFNDTTNHVFQITVQGSDEGSGLANYLLYLSEYGNAFSLVGEFETDGLISYPTNADTNQIAEIFTIAVDSVGLREDMKVSGTLINQDSTTSIEQVFNTSTSLLSILNIFPVPTIDQVNVEFISDHPNVMMKVIDLQGKILQNQAIRVIPDEKNTTTLEVSHLAQGTYFIVIQNKNGINCKGIIKIK